MNLSRRTNDYFTKFVGNWLKSDAIASHFVFELGGFEFLLDTIGKREEGKSSTNSEKLSLGETNEEDESCFYPSSSG
jgi:hypothetical protein